MASDDKTIDKNLTGDTNPKRHRRLRAMLMGLLVACALVAVGVLVVVARAAQGSMTRQPEPAPSAEQLLASEPVVEEAADPDAEPPQSEPEVEPEPKPVELKLMMIGDLLMHEGVIYSGAREDGTFNYDHLFAHITDDINEADVAMLNQETVLGGTAFPYSGYPVFNSPQELGDSEVALGFDVICKATNHTLDLGYDGIRAELAYWGSSHPDTAIIGMADPDGNGICPAGGTSPAGAYITEKDGFKIALLNYTSILNGNVDYEHDWQVIGQPSEDGIRNDVNAAREAGADLVITVMHWGSEYVNTPTDDEHYWASVLSEAGVDVIIGGHPHVIQPVEILSNESGHRTLVFWSVGNFVSSQPWAYTMVGGMAKVSMVKDTDGARVTSYEFIPVVNVRAANTTNQTAFKLRDFTDEQAALSDISLYDGGNGGTAAWYQNYCAEVLGDSFDWETMSVHGSMS